MQTGEAATQAIRSSQVGSGPAPLHEFEKFFRTYFRELVKTAMYAGATLTEAEDAVAKTLTEMLPYWVNFEHPLAYARRAVLNNFIKDKTRGSARTSRRLVERGWVSREDGAEDRQLTVWEDKEWVNQQLRSLPPAQREVMEYIVAGFTPAEIAGVLGKTRETIRRNLCDARKRLVVKLQEHEQNMAPSSPRGQTP